MNQLAPVDQNGSRSVIELVASRYNMEKAAFVAVVRDQVSPKGRDAQPLTNEQLAALMVVANEYGLNPLTKEIYAFPAKGGGVVPILSIDGWAGLVARHPQADGYDFSFTNAEDGTPISCSCTMYRKDRGHPIVVTEYYDECKRNTDPWKSHPRRMLRHKALIQAARYAFGFAGIYDEDEGRIIADDRPAPPPVPAVPSIPDNPIVDVEANQAPTTATDASTEEASAPAEGRPRHVYADMGKPAEAEPLIPPAEYNERIAQYGSDLKNAADAEILGEVWDLVREVWDGIMEPDQQELSNIYDERMGAFEG